MSGNSAASKHSSLYLLNSLFSEWLTEWKNEAASRELKSQYTYAKALHSLKKYPLPLESAKECKMLGGFGSKICEMLEARLMKYNSRQGELAGSSSVSSSTRAPSSFYSPDSGSEADVDTVARPHKSKSGTGLRQKQNTCRAAGYIPRKNSGPYALIMALYRHQRSDTESGYMLKRQLIDTAQPLCENSFTRPEVGSRYTAWSSMGTLINKGFVSKSNFPARYSITESGCKLACKLLRVDECNTAEESLETSPLKECFRSSDVEKTSSGSSDGKLYSKRDKSDSTKFFVDCREVDRQSADSRNVTGHSSQEVTGQFDVAARFTNADNVGFSGSHSQNLLSFVYVDPEENEVLMKDRAAVIIDDEVTIGFHIKVKYQDLLSSAKRYKLDTDRQCSSGYVFAYMHNEDAPEVASLQPCVKTSGEFAAELLTSNNEVQITRTEDCLNSAISCEVTESLAAEKNYLLPEAVERLPGETAEKKRRHVPRTKSKSMTSSCDEMQDFPSAAGIMIDSQKDFGQPDHRLRPGSFCIVLCVDNQEYYTSGGSHNKQLLTSELDKLGVHYEVRKLQVGDFLWIAQQDLGDCGSGNRIELVLDYIVERKRMDDLGSSIIDGRFKEQKHRLRNCGLSNVIFLIEDFGSVQHFSISEDALKQAVTNIKIVDGFFVKRTHNTRESAVYLALMTGYLQSIYSKKNLLGYKSHFSASEVSCSLHDSESNLMMFEDFSDSSVKTKALSVSEMFGKHLLQLSGFTAEKASIFLKHYSTPQSLLNAYDDFSADKNSLMMLTDLKCGPTKRNFGASLSKNTAMLYCTNGPLP